MLDHQLFVYDGREEGEYLDAAFAGLALREGEDGAAVREPEGVDGDVDAQLGPRPYHRVVLELRLLVHKHPAQHTRRLRARRREASLKGGKIAGTVPGRDAVYLSPQQGFSNRS